MMRRRRGGFRRGRGRGFARMGRRRGRRVSSRRTRPMRIGFRF